MSVLPAHGLRFTVNDNLTTDWRLPVTATRRPAVSVERAELPPFSCRLSKCLSFIFRANQIQPWRWSQLAYCNIYYLYTKLRDVISHKSESYVDRFLSLVETGVVKHLLKQGSPPTEICPLDLRSTERQLRNIDLFATYMVVVIGFFSAIVAFVGEVSTQSSARRIWAPEI